MVFAAHLNHLRTKVMTVSSAKFTSTLALFALGAFTGSAAVSLSIDWSSDPGSSTVFATGSSGGYRYVASGGGIIEATSYSPSNHGEVKLIGDDSGTSYGQGIAYNTSSWTNASNFGYNPASSFVNNATTSIWVYIDDPNLELPDGDGGFFEAYGDGDGWFWQPSLQNNLGNALVDTGGFGIQVVDNGTSLEWQIAADGIGAGFQDGLQFAGNPDNANTSWLGGVGNEVYTIDTAAIGWYLLETTWMQNGSAVDQINSIYDESNTLVYQATIAGAVGNVADAGDQGVNQLGHVADASTRTWYSGATPNNSAMWELAIDDISIVPEPEIYGAIFGLISFLAVLRLRRKV